MSEFKTSAEARARLVKIREASVFCTGPKSSAHHAKRIQEVEEQAESLEREERALWRVGRKVPRNLYRGDEPIAMLATAEIAAALALALNFTETVPTTEPLRVRDIREVKTLREAMARAFPAPRRPGA